MLILELVRGLQTIRCLGLRAVKMQSECVIFGKLQLRIYTIHEVVIQSYEGKLENQLDSRGMSLKPRQRLKHSVNASGSWGSLIHEVPTCLWLTRGNSTLEPPTCTAFVLEIYASLHSICFPLPNQDFVFPFVVFILYKFLPLQIYHALCLELGTLFYLVW